MISNIQRLIFLCQVKNDLNRKRRRFYYYMTADCTYEPEWFDKSHISRDQAQKGYRSAQKQMKAMTKEMRKMRLEMGAEIIWGDSGNITHVKYQGYRLPQTKFKAFYEAELFEIDLFKDL